MEEIFRELKAAASSETYDQVVVSALTVKALIEGQFKLMNLNSRQQDIYFDILRGKQEKVIDDAVFTFRRA